MPTVRLEREGLFGPVGVVDTAEARRFSIRGVLQGASLLVPSAASVDPSLGNGPGPVIETRYQLAWFLAGQRHPSGRGLMLGLGGGTGAVGLLDQFPDLRMDAVEADPAMAAMAREFHPLVGHFERLGRLGVHVAEAGDFLERSGEQYDFAIVDVTVDADSVARTDPGPLVGAVAGATRECWYRVFGSLPDGDLRALFDGFRACDFGVDWLYSPVSPHVPIPRARDWIVAAGVRRPPDPDAFVPYAGARGRSPRAIGEAYRKLASQPLRAA